MSKSVSAARSKPAGYLPFESGYWALGDGKWTVAALTRMIRHELVELGEGPKKLEA